MDCCASASSRSSNVIPVAMCSQPSHDSKHLASLSALSMVVSSGWFTILLAVFLDTPALSTICGIPMPSASMSSRIMRRAVSGSFSNGLLFLGLPFPPAFFFAIPRPQTEKGPRPASRGPDASRD